MKKRECYYYYLLIISYIEINKKYCSSHDDFHKNNINTEKKQISLVTKECNYIQHNDVIKDFTKGGYPRLTFPHGHD